MMYSVYMKVVQSMESEASLGSLPMVQYLKFFPKRVSDSFARSPAKKWGGGRAPNHLGFGFYVAEVLRAYSQVFYVDLSVAGDVFVGVILRIWPVDAEKLGYRS